MIMAQMRHFVTGAALAAALAAAAPSATAQVVIGDSSEASVEVNLDVLDSLAPGAAASDGLYGEQFQAPSSTGSVLLIAPSGQALPEPQPASGAGSVLLLDQPATTPAIAGSALLIPEVPGTRPEAPAGAQQSTEVVTTATEAGSVTTTTTTTVVPVPEPAPEVPAEAAAAPEPEATVAATEPAATDTLATDTLATDTTDDPFAQLDDMLSEPIAPESIEVPEPDMALDTAAMAAMPAPEVGTDGLDLRILFEPGADAMTDQDRTLLKSLADRLASDEQQRVQLRAYAASDDGTASSARRLALARALQVRAYLIENGVRSTRIDVRALGDKVEDSGPVDRIDVVLVAS